MAYGNELVLGFRPPNWHIIEEALNFKMPENKDLFWHTRIHNNGFDPEVQAALLDAWKKACDDMGWKFIKEKNNHHFIFETPLGEREFSPWTLEFQYDPNEMGEVYREHGVICVAISGRYFPTFLDWRDPHGTVWNLVVGPDIPKEMMVARKRIIEAVPCFEQAEWIVREKHY